MYTVNMGVSSDTARSVVDQLDRLHPCVGLVVNIFMFSMYAIKIVPEIYTNIRTGLIGKVEETQKPNPRKGYSK